jgi:hypothetical protein
MVEYEGYFIVGHALRVHPTSSDWWRSQGNVFTDTAEGTILPRPSKASSSSRNVPRKTTAWNSAKSGWTRG